MYVCMEDGTIMCNSVVAKGRGARFGEVGKGLGSRDLCGADGGFVVY